MVDTREDSGRRKRAANGSMLRAFAHRNYRLFFGGQLVSLVGTWMQSVAQAWLVYRLTGSAVLLGMVGFAGQIPVFLLSPIGGSVADAFNRRRVIMVTQAVSMATALALAGLTLSGSVRLWEIFAIASILGTVNAFDIPARQSFLVEMVGRADLMNAIALNSSMFNAARIVGPAIAGLLLAEVGEGWCFFLNGLSYVAVLIALRAMSPRPSPDRPRMGSPIGRIVEGLAYSAKTGPIRALLLVVGLVSLEGMPYAVLMPVFAKEILHSDARGLGLLMGASGLGALLGALTLARRQEVRGLGRWVARATAALGLALIAFAMSHHFWLSAGLLVPVGFAMLVQTAASNTLIQAMVPDELRGRVMAAYSMMFMGMAPIGALLAGWMAGRIGAPGAVAVGGVACLVGAAVFRLRLPGLRVVARELLIAQEQFGAERIDATLPLKAGGAG